ncbi:MAG TPA: site-2 protease family protein [Acidimicrobiales bacterium]
MEQDIRLGRIAGIPVGMNWSIGFIFVLIAWEMADLVLPAAVPHASSAVCWTVGLAATVLFFVSLLAHEASHAIVATHHGVAVRRITLWLFGGVSELESNALSPSADFRIAVVGPLTSLVLAALFGLARFALGHGSGTGAVLSAAIGWLAWINLTLGVFNLVPAAPLDGGRVLRAVLWARSGDRASAAAAATRAGQAFGYVLVTFGVLEFLTVGIFGLWMVFLGWFLLSAARAEEGSTMLRAALGQLSVRDLMTRDPVTIPAATTVADMIDTELLHHHFGTFPLVDAKGELVGLTTMSRLRRVAPHDRGTTQLIDVACPIAGVPSAGPDAEVVDVLARMQTSPDGRALIIDQGRLVGIISPTDVMRYMQVAALKRSTARR